MATDVLINVAVKSVNGETGHVNVTPTSIGAAASSHTHLESDITNLGNYIVDSPSDGNLYGRENNTWVIIPDAFDDAPTTSLAYIRRNQNWEQPGLEQTGRTASNIGIKISNTDNHKGYTIPAATTVLSGLLSATDKVNIDNIQNIPNGGTTNQVLSKIDNTDYNVEWSSSIEEAPLDGFIYSRKDSTWVRINPTYYVTNETELLEASSNLDGTFGIIYLANSIDLTQDRTVNFNRCTIQGNGFYIEGAYTLTVSGSRVIFENVGFRPAESTRSTNFNILNFTGSSVITDFRNCTFRNVSGSIDANVDANPVITMPNLIYSCRIRFQGCSMYDEYDFNIPQCMVVDMGDYSNSTNGSIRIISNNWVRVNPTVKFGSAVTGVIAVTENKFVINSDSSATIFESAENAAFEDFDHVITY
jgi:hypothetical protein